MRRVLAFAIVMLAAVAMMVPTAEAVAPDERTGPLKRDETRGASEQRLALWLV